MWLRSTSSRARCGPVAVAETVLAEDVRADLQRGPGREDDGALEDIRDFSPKSARTLGIVRPLDIRI